MNYIREAITQQHIGEEAIALRRHLHAHPDLSEQEFPTMELVCEHLDAAGIPYERNVAESGVVGLIKVLTAEQKINSPICQQGLVISA